MNVVFVYSLDDIQSSKAPLRTQEQIQFGISYISSFLKKNGHNTKLIVLSKVFGGAYKAIIDKCVKEFAANIFCFTAINSEYNFILTVAKYVKMSYPDIYLLIGGCHASLNPTSISLNDFDALCIGEGEMPTLELVSQLENGLLPSTIHNLWIKRNGGIEKNLTRPFLQNLDDLPFPDREMWQNWIKEQLGARISILLGRGCPFECAYCCNSALKKISGGSYVRFRSVDNILAEIENIVTTYPGKKEIYLEVESFGINTSWAIKLCNELENFNETIKEPLSFGVNLRVAAGLDYVSLFSALRKANFKFINIGLESGSERLRREVLCRNYSNEEIVSVVRLARVNGLKVNFFNMIGIPGETQLDFRETVKINRICLPDKRYTSIFFPYAGTKLYSLCKKNGLLKDEPDTVMERRKAFLDSPGFSKNQIQKGYIWFDYYIYKGSKPLPEILIKVLVKKLQANPFLNLFFRKFVRLPLLKKIRRALTR
jgi:radical SAM superfamily enzyme YgiQ (UPF0313 family)